MGAGFHGGFGATKGSRNSNEAYPGTVKLVKSGTGEKFGQYAMKAPPKPGYTDVIIHGNPDTDLVSVYPNGKWTDMDQRRLAKYVKHDIGYKSGPIRLISCSTGTKEFAQNFANKMGVEVISLLAKNENIFKMANRHDRIISSNRRRVIDIMRLIPRNSYMEKIINVIGTPDIKVITGVRRCGKSKLLESFKKYVDENIQDANVIHINFNLPEFEELLTFRALYEHINSLYKENMRNFVLIDEVQMCEDFEKAINGLHASEKYDIYITGSNAFLLSSDLATLFTGRTFEIKVFPFSFKEYVRYFDLSDRYEALSSYIKEGGMAGSYLYKDPEAKYDYIADVFDTLIVRDIRQKYKIRNTQLMDRIVDFLMDNISNLSSARNITNVLGSMNEKIHHTTVGSYIQYLCNAFAFYKIRRYDIKGKKYLSSNDKYYLSDHTFRYAKLGTRNMDYGRILENIVAIELLRRGYEVYVGVLYKKEIDFVAIKRSEKIYIQVSDNISDDKTFEREVSPLLQVKDAYPKMLIARTRNDEYQYEGIKIVDLADWLLEA